MVKKNMEPKLRNSGVLRQPVALSRALDRQLNSCALAAGAAGVALLACSVSAAEAAPVCKNPSVQLHRSTTYPLNPGAQAIAPFNIGQSTVVYSGVGYSSSRVNWNRAFFASNSLAANAVVDSKGFPADLAFGTAIGPGGKFGKGASYALMFTYGKGPGPEP